MADTALLKSEMRTNTARTKAFLRLEEFLSAQGVCSPEAREEARTNALLAFEAYLDICEEFAVELLKSQGIDPWSRHLRN